MGEEKTFNNFVLDMLCILSIIYLFIICALQTRCDTRVQVARCWLTCSFFSRTDSIQIKFNPLFNFVRGTTLLGGSK